MNITIIGGGNLGTLMAASFAYRGHDVTIQTSKPKVFNKTIKVYDNNDKYLYSGTIKKVLNNYEESIKNANIIWVVVPPQMFSFVSSQILPFIKENQYIGIVPGAGYAEYAFKEVSNKGIFFGLARVPGIARIKTVGDSVYSLGAAPELLIGSIPSDNANKVCQTIQPLFSMKCRPVSNYLTIALTPSNPILHTSRIYSMFKDYSPNKYYPQNELFYESWTIEAGKILLECSNELQYLCKALPLDMRDVESMQERHDIKTPEELAKKIQELDRLKGLYSPVIKKDKGYIPDFNSRYFISDFPLGIKFHIDVAELFDTPHFTMKKIWSWYKKLQPNQAKTRFKLPKTIQEFLMIYR